MDLTNVFKTIDQIGNYLAEKLKMPFEYAMGILQKEYWYLIWSDIVWMILFTIILIVGNIFCNKLKPNLSNKTGYLDDFTHQDILEIFRWVGSVVIIIIMVMIGFSLLHGLINPEIFIFKNIIKPML